MSFKLGDIIVDRIQLGVAESFEGELLATLTQLSEATIDISAESKDAVDKDGTLVKRFWQGKTGDFSATNAFLSLPVIALESGKDSATIATDENVVKMPRIIKAKATDRTVAVPGYQTGYSMRVYGMSTNGTLGDEYTRATGGASATQYSVAGTGADAVLTLPTGDDELYVIKFDRDVTSGAVIKNKADVFPDTFKLTLKVLAVDPCEADTLKAGYVEFPSFQPSPETSISLTTDGNLDFNGSLQVD